MQWKVTRNGKDIFAGDLGISKQDALEHARLFNRWATRYGGRPTYGIRPIEEPREEPEAEAYPRYEGRGVRYRFGKVTPGFNSHDRGA